MKKIYLLFMIFIFGCTATKTPIITPSKTYNFVKIVSVDKDGVKSTHFIGAIK